MGVQRQFQHVFDATIQAQVVGHIGCTLAQLDPDWKYTTRIHCMFEAFATVRYGGQLLVQTWLDSPGMTARLACDPISVELAVTGNQAETDEMLSMIRSSIGISAMNASFTRALHQGVVACERHWF